MDALKHLDADLLFALDFVCTLNPLFHLQVLIRVEHLDRVYVLLVVRITCSVLKVASLELSFILGLDPELEHLLSCVRLEEGVSHRQLAQLRVAQSQVFSRYILSLFLALLVKNVIRGAVTLEQVAIEVASYLVNRELRRKLLRLLLVLTRATADCLGVE